MYLNDDPILFAYYTLPHFVLDMLSVMQIMQI